MDILAFVVYWIEAHIWQVATILIIFVIIGCYFKNARDTAIIVVYTTRMLRELIKDIDDTWERSSDNVKSILKQRVTDDTYESIKEYVGNVEDAVSDLCYSLNINRSELFNDQEPLRERLLQWLKILGNFMVGFMKGAFLGLLAGMLIKSCFL